MPSEIKDTLSEIALSFLFNDPLYFFSNVISLIFLFSLLKYVYEKSNVTNVIIIYKNILNVTSLISKFYKITLIIQKYNKNINFIVSFM